MTTAIIDRLPAEVLQPIFIGCLPTDKLPTITFTEPPLLFTRICKRWKSVAEMTRELWTSLHLVIPNPGNPDIVDWDVHHTVFENWLHCTGDRPLKIEVEEADPEFQDQLTAFRRPVTVDDIGQLMLMQALIEQFRERGEDDTVFRQYMLTLMGWVRQWEDVSLALYSERTGILRAFSDPIWDGNIFEGLKHFRFKEIHCDIYYPSSDYMRQSSEPYHFFEDVVGLPALTSMAFCDITSPNKWRNILSPALLLKLHKLTLTGSGPALWNILSSKETIELPNLTDLVLEGVKNWGSDLNVADFLNILILPALTSLTTSSYSHLCLPALPRFLKRSAPPLKHLDLTLYFNDENLIPDIEEDLLSSLRLCTQLEEFRLHYPWNSYEFDDEDIETLEECTEEMFDSFTHDEEMDSPMCPLLRKISLLDAFAHTAESMPDTLISFIDSRINPPPGASVSRIEKVEILTEWTEDELPEIKEERLKTKSYAGIVQRWKDNGLDVTIDLGYDWYSRSE